MRSEIAFSLRPLFNTAKYMKLVLPSDWARVVYKFNFTVVETGKFFLFTNIVYQNCGFWWADENKDVFWERACRIVLGICTLSLETCFPISNKATVTRAFEISDCIWTDCFFVTIMIRGWTEQKMNLRFFTKFNQNTVRWFQENFRRVLGVLATWWCLVNFWKSRKPWKIIKKIVRPHQVTSTPETLRKLTWNLLTVFRLNF